MKYEPLMEKLLTYFTGPAYRDEVVEAKKDFFEDAGLIDHESHHFEVRMAQFLDWYLFSRELSTNHLTPVQFSFEKPPFECSENEKLLLENLTLVRHGLFEYLKTSRSNVYVKDLFSGKKHVLKDSHVTTGFNREELFEARLIPTDDTWVFAKGFCFHPAESKAYILKEIKKIKHLEGAPREALMLKLLKMRYKYEQYRHIRIEYIYTNESKLKV